MMSPAFQPDPFARKDKNGHTGLPVGKWSLVRYSDITGEHYLDRVFRQERSALKALAESNRYERHSASFRVQDVASALAQGAVWPTGHYSKGA